MKYNVALYNKKIITSQNTRIKINSSFTCINCGRELFFDGNFFVHRDNFCNHINEETLIKMVLYIMKLNYGY